MKIANLIYAIVGLIAYYKQTKEQDVHIEATEENLVRVITVDDKELSVHCVPDIKKLGILYGALYNFRNKAHIYVDDRFFEDLTSTQQAALLYHEVAHYKYGHTKKTFKEIWNVLVTLGKMVCSNKKRNLLVESTMLTRDYTSEFQADEFAAKYCGIDAVRSLLLVFSMTAPSPEISQRYRALTGENIKTSPYYIDFKERLINLGGYDPAVINRVESYLGE
jgi:hypothetical protein